MDSLRYWVTEMHVDGFRFDLASTLAREFYDVDRLSTFFELVQQDPVVSQVKLIAEPWDIGPGGYQVGGFPPQWTEWNGAYRDTVRDFWRGEPSLGEFASRIAGSSDLYEHSGRRPFASINFVTAHDGFTLRDLVSYNEKHNDANGEDNKDGESHNRSWNHGAEGPTDDPEILAARAREQRNFIATLLLSQGVPMLLHGDEMSRTQSGNNNTYAQDSEISWVHWDDADRPLIEFTAAVARLRQEHPTFRRKRFFTGGSVRVPAGADGDRLNDIVWLHLDGRPMEQDDWDDGAQAIGMYLNGHGIAGLDPRGQKIVDEHFLLYFNADGPAEVTLPPDEYADAWEAVIDTGAAAEDDSSRPAGSTFTMETRSVVVLKQYTPPEVEPDRPPRRRSPPSRRHSREEEDRLMRVPVSTYRLQVTEEFDLFEVARRLPYLHDLGADWVYLSPLLAAETKSAHGYEVVAHDQIDESRGGAAGLDAVVAEARRLGLGVLIDIVPNHVGIATPRDNPWWWDLLENGRAPRTRRPSTSTGTLEPAGSGSRSSATTTRARSGSRTAKCATTSTASRWHPAPPRSRSSTTSSCTGRSPTTASTTAASSPSTPWPESGVEDPDVLADSHVEIRRWFDDGLADGLRVDHPDGLRDPRGYLDDLGRDDRRRLRARGEDPRTRRAASDDVGDRRHHRVRRTRPGRPGADRPGGPGRRSTPWSPGCAALPVDWHQLIHDTKREVADGILRSEVNRVTRELRGGRRARSTTGRSPTPWRRAARPASRSTAPTSPRVASICDRAVELARTTGPTWTTALDAVVRGPRRPRVPRPPSGSSRPRAR